MGESIYLSFLKVFDVRRIIIKGGKCCVKTALGTTQMLETFYLMKWVYFRGGFRDFEKRSALCRPPWLAAEESFRFQMV